MRVLHLLSGGRALSGAFDEAAAICGRVVPQRTDEHTVVLLGSPRLRSRAADLGLHVNVLLSPPSGRAALAWRGIQKAFRRSRAEVVCCWDRESVAAAILSLGRDIPLVHIGAERLSRSSPLSPRRWESLAYNDMERPPVGSVQSDDAARSSLRESLGIGPDEVAVLLIGTGADASAVRFAFTLGLSRRAGQPVVGIAPAWSDQLARARYYERRLTTGVRIVETPLPARTLLAAADLGLWVGGGRSTTWLPEGRPSRTAAAACFAAGVPLIAPRNFGLEDLYPSDAAEECLAEIGMPPELARRVYPLVLDPQRVKALGSLCREHWRGTDGTAALAAAIHESCHRVATTGGWGEVVVRQMGALQGA